MKYKDSQGNFQDIYVKVGDNIPVGGEMDFDGNTVPVGWEEIDTKDGIVLYNNDTGSKTNITLSDDVSNYSYLEIYYSNDRNRPTCTKIPLKSSLSLTEVPLTIIFMVTSDKTFRFRTKAVNIINNEIRVSGYSGLATTTSNTISYENTDYITIHKVIGYK